MRIKGVQEIIDKIRGKKHVSSKTSQLKFGKALVDKFIIDDLAAHGFKFDNSTSITESPDGLSFDIGFQPYVLWEQYLCNDYFYPETDKKIIAFDIGMNAAFVTLRLANMKNVEAVYSFEPFENTYKLALRNIDLNSRIKDKIHTYNFGLSNKDEQISTLYEEGLAGNMSLTHNHYDGSESVFKKENASSVTVKVKDAYPVVKDIIEKHPDKLVLIKCDTEGSEFEIFESLYNNNLLSSIDFVMLEYHYRDPKILQDYLTKAGFFVFKKENGIMLYAMKHR